MKKVLMFAVLLIILVTGCSRNPSSRQSRDRRNVETKETPELVTETDESNFDVKPIVKTSDVKPIVNIYIENSGSMNGFINEISEFQEDILEILPWLEDYYDIDNIKMHYINEKVIYKEKPESITLLDFAQKMLSLKEFKSN